jgi:hypothetical protein
VNVTLLTLIAAGEVAFWVVLGGGLVARYVLRRPRLGAALLLCVPVVDLSLLVATAVDLRLGGEAQSTHGLAYAYLGFTIAFGRRVVRWGDERFAHRFAAAPAPRPVARDGPTSVRHEWQIFREALLAWAISVGLMLITIGAIGDAGAGEALWIWIAQLTLVIAIWSLLPLSASLRRAPSRPDASGCIPVRVRPPENRPDPVRARLAGCGHRRASCSGKAKRAPRDGRSSLCRRLSSPSRA